MIKHKIEKKVVCDTNQRKSSCLRVCNLRDTHTGIPKSYLYKCAYILHC
jgi:hypothetical protein